MTVQDQQPTSRRGGPFSRWRTRDILITAAIGVVFGVVFFFWNAFYAAIGPAFTAFPPLQAALYGVWLVPGILAPYLTRKAGSGVLAEVVAALVEMIFGGWGGAMVLLYGLAQGAAAELGYAIVGYRVWRKAMPFVAGATAGLAPAILDNVLYYPTWAFGWQVTDGLLAIVSTSLIGGAISLGLSATLRSSGALPATR